MFKKVSIYWKCQLWGWGIVGILYFIIAVPTYTKSTIGDSIVYIAFMIVIGILSTHLMRLLIRRLRLTEISIGKAILPILLLTLFFGIITGVLGQYLSLIIKEWNKNSVSENAFLLFEATMNGCLLLFLWNTIYFFYHYQRRNKKQEQEKTALKIQAVELEAKALRSQMNPHFIFNCLNSIKSLIQDDQKEKSVTYLTTFSKLIRTLFNNADKKEITLYDEIETCKLYLQLEAMRFDTKFSYAVNVDDSIDLKSVPVPALIIQPFIENAIWHGIMPRNNGGRLSLNVSRKNDAVEIVIEDDGIGREASQQNKSSSTLTHQSKGVNLTQARLELDNLLQQRQATLETIDKKDENGIATGTKVIITIKEEI